MQNPNAEFLVTHNNSKDVARAQRKGLSFHFDPLN